MEWKASANEVVLRYNSLTYDKNTRPTTEEWQKAEEHKTSAMKGVDESYEPRAKELFTRANEIRLASAKWINAKTERETDELFSTYATNGVTSLDDRRPLELSQYLLEISKRL